MIGSGQENRKRCLVETPGPADLTEGRDSVGGLPLPGRDHVAFGAPALGNPPAVGAIGCRTLACGCHEQNDSDAQAREACIPKLHGGLLRGIRFPWLRLGPHSAIALCGMWTATGGYRATVCAR